MLLRGPITAGIALRLSHRVAGALLIACAVALPQIARAERIEPPLELLHDPSNLLVAGTVEEVDPVANRVVFKRTAILSGNPQFAQADELEVRGPHELIAQIASGKDYVFGYTLFAPDPRRPGRLVGKRLGAALLVAPGLEPGAAFADTPALRRLLAATMAGTEQDIDERGNDRDAAGTNDDTVHERLGLLLATLAGKDRALQNLAANELMLAPDLRARFGAHERETLRRFAADPGASGFGRMAVLEAAAHHPESFGAGWALDVAGKLLSTAATGFERPDAEREALLRTALLLFDQTTESALPARTLERWLRSDSLALVEPAWRQLQRRSPADARAAVARAADDAGTPAPTRAFLHDILQRTAAQAQRPAA